MTSYRATAEAVLANVGGKENIEFVNHCVTRLRFNLKDQGLANMEALGTVPGALGSRLQNGQVQVIVGQTVASVYKELCDLAGITEAESVDGADENIDSPPARQRRRWSPSIIFDVLSACFAPLIPGFAGAGIIKGILTMSVTFKWLSNDTGLYLVLSAVSDAVFYFLPMMLAFTAARRFETNTTLAMILGGLFLYPTILEKAGTTVNVLGLDVHLVKYSASVLPILLSIWILSYVYRFFFDRVPEYLRIVLVPLLTLLLMAPICLMVVGPLGYYGGVCVGDFFKWLFDTAPLLAGLVDGATRPWVILTGTHMMMGPIMINQIGNYGYEMFGPVHACASMAAAGMSLGVFLRARKADIKSSSFSAFISGFIGITEPALYGVAFRFRRPLWALMIGGGVSGAFVAAMGAKAIAFAMPSIISLPAYTGSIPIVLIGLAIAFFLTAGLAYAFGLDEGIQKDERAAAAERKAIKTPTATNR